MISFKYEHERHRLTWIERDEYCTVELPLEDVSSVIVMAKAKLDSGEDEAKVWRWCKRVAYSSIAYLDLDLSIEHAYAVSASLEENDEA